MTTTDNAPQNPVSEWDQVMKPLAATPLWPSLRDQASRILVARLHEMGDFDSGISGSDINHTIYGMARFVDSSLRADPGAFAHAVLAWMEDERL
jgi:hypothetical protein